MLSAKELKTKKEKELLDILVKTKKELEETMGNVLQNKEKNVKKASGLKKDIARILTVINEKKIEEVKTK